ncbi:MAG: hypothetical protein AB8G95_29835 [Anaerolineae bacterium]
MKLIKENFWPTVIIIVASFIVIFAFWPLENSSFAEGFRTGEVAEGGEGISSDEGAEDSEEPFGENGRLTGAAALLPLIKVAALMGIGVLFTAIGTGIARLINRLRSPSPPPA